MPKMIVLGAGVCGLAAGMMLHWDGHDVTILEHDPEPRAPFGRSGMGALAA